MKTNKINQRIEEASLKGNPAIPGEGGKEGGYLSDVERRAEERNAELARRHGGDIPRFMSFVSQARQIQSGKEKELEKLAEKAIRAMYGSILDEVELKIRFPKPGAIKDMMEKVQPEAQEMPQLKQLEDAGIISEIHKRKIANNITQGEAKNTKLMLNLPEVVDGLEEIMGRENGRKYVDLLNKITEIAGFFDWNIPMEVQKEMWTRDKSGFSGSVKVEWETPEDSKENEENAQDILDKLMNSSDLPEDDVEDLFDETKPTIHALGTDFAMLLHETVKGIYELIAANAIPDDEEDAEIIISNTDSLADEIEDLRYGPEIAADLRDFINGFPESNKVENLREHVFGKLMLLPAKQFLDTIFYILSDDPRGKHAIQKLINEVVEEINDYKDAIKNGDFESPSDNEPEEEGEVDYENMSKRDLMALIDQALDAEDYDRVRDLSQYLKESKQRDLFERVHQKLGYPGKRDI